MSSCTYASPFFFFFCRAVNQTASWFSAKESLRHYQLHCKVRQPPGKERNWRVERKLRTAGPKRHRRKRRAKKRAEGFLYPWFSSGENMLIRARHWSFRAPLSWWWTGSTPPLPVLRYQWCVGQMQTPPTFVAMVTVRGKDCGWWLNFSSWSKISPTSLWGKIRKTTSF